MSEQNLGAQVRTAFRWELLSKSINILLYMITSIVLARLLLPDDFGIVAMASIVTGLVAVFQSLGLDQALVQRDQISKEHIQAVFWSTMVLAVLLYAAVYFLAPSLAQLFHEPRIIQVLRVIGLTFILAPFCVVPRALLQRKLDFRTPLFAGLIGSACYGLVGIVLALSGYGYWALVFALVVLECVQTIALCILTRYLPPLVPAFRSIRDLWGFGTGVMMSSVGYYIASRIDYFVIGRRLDSNALGLYTRAYQFISYPAVLAGMISPVFLPAFSRMQQDLPRMRSAYGRVLTLLAMLFFPVLTIAVIVAPEFIPLVLGEQWTPSVVPTQVLVFLGMFEIIRRPTEAVLKASGQVYQMAWRQFLYSALLGIGAWFAAPHGIVAVAAVVACVGVLHAILISHLVWLSLDFGITGFALAFRGPTLVMLATATVGVVCRYCVLSEGYGGATILVATVLCATISGFRATLAMPLPEMRDSVRELVAFVRREVGAHAG